jgi:hypothetical protein
LGSCLKVGKIPSCGSTELHPHSDFGYFEVPSTDGPELWERRWFYATDVTQDYRENAMPVFADVPCRQRLEWSSKIDFEPKTGLLIQAVLEMRERGLAGLQLEKTWVDAPLGSRASPMFDYKGLDDPDCLLQRELPEGEVKARMHLIIGLPLGAIHMGVTIEPFSRANPSDSLIVLHSQAQRWRPLLLST